jgi:hypothetical protein
MASNRIVEFHEFLKLALKTYSYLVLVLDAF